MNYYEFQNLIDKGFDHRYRISNKSSSHLQMSTLFHNDAEEGTENKSVNHPVLCVFSTSVDVQYIGGYHEYIGGYHEYIGGCSVHRG